MLLPAWFQAFLLMLLEAWSTRRDKQIQLLKFQIELLHKKMPGQQVTMISRSDPSSPEPSPYLSPKELAQRWRCSRSSVDRIARRAGLSRVCLGDGVNGMVRYLRKEVAAYEATRRVAMASA